MEASLWLGLNALRRGKVGLGTPMTLVARQRITARGGDARSTTRDPAARRRSRARCALHDGGRRDDGRRRCTRARIIRAAGWVHLQAEAADEGRVSVSVDRVVRTKTSL